MSFDDLSRPSFAIGIAGSPGPGPSRSHLLLDAALERLDKAGFVTRRIELASFPADALLGRTRDPGLDAAIAQVSEARVLLAATPVYRASYSGLLKVFFDLLPADALEGRVAIPIATGGSLAHQLMLDHALRPLLASLGARVVSTGVYGTQTQFTDGRPETSLQLRLARAVDEAIALSQFPAAFYPTTPQPSEVIR